MSKYYRMFMTSAVASLILCNEQLLFQHLRHHNFRQGLPPNNACTRTAVLAPLKWLNLSESFYPINRLALNRRRQRKRWAVPSIVFAEMIREGITPRETHFRIQQ